ncbi:MAG: phosphatidate cytidylyltransferase [Treponema sp.]|jgi:phosphatidate cytidylyltransferase|nr:phosphatidate cytidylyltransferase [Treponema sp.]
MIKRLIQRLLIFFVGIPAIVALVVLLPQYNHLAVNIAVIAASSIGAAEFSLMLKKKGFAVHTPEAVVLGALSPLSMTLSVSFGISSQLTPAFFIVGASWLLVSVIFYRSGSSDSGDFSGVLNRLAAGFSVLMYPGHFLSWIIRMSLFKHSVIVILMFVLTVMVNDSAAWAFGMLFGKSNRGIVPVSPNKSVAGFAAGLLASVAVCTGAVYLIPGAFEPDKLPRLPGGIFLGLFSGIAVTLGDLAESAIKRCCNVKDSGSLIPGRGGMLDSIDSIAFTAPVFFMLYRFFF